MPIGNETTANVHCVDEGGEMVTKTEDMTINTSKQWLLDYKSI